MDGSHRVAVVGGGSFGTVIANIIAANGHRISLWMRDGERAALVNQNKENPTYLPGYKLHENLSATPELEAAIADIDVLFVAVPSKSCREVARNLSRYLAPATLVISLTKGIEPTGFKLMSDILHEELPGNPLGVLSGPNLAREVAEGHVTGSVIASANEVLIDTVQTLLKSQSFHVYDSHDMYGVELGGALKNVYAILAGMAAARQAGENTVGMLLTRSLAEMSRFAVHMGANPLTFLGLAGVGDLFVTCSSPLSRNYRVGYALGQGQTLDAVLADMDQVAEGINTLKLLKSEADRRDVHMPLVDGLYGVLYEGRTLEAVMDSLMAAGRSQDVEFVVRP